jgi:hypothetical protein
MVQTISPVVHGGRARWLGTVALHTMGATGVAALFGATLGWIGQALGAPWQRPGLLALAAISAVYAFGVLTRFRVPVPQLRRQVPDWWRTYFGRSFAALLYGAGLGIGFLTYVSYGTLTVVAFAAVASGRPGVGALVMAPFGLARGASAVVSWGSIDQERSRALVDRLVAAGDTPRRIVNGVALVSVAIAAGVASARVGVGVGSGGSFAAAALAAVFGWASASKVVGPRRWHLALTAYGLPLRLGRTAAWAVPAAESFVPLLIVAGLPRAAAVWSGALLVLFSGALLRAGRRVGGRVPCGCLGGSGDIRVHTAMVRIGALILVAVFVFRRASDSPLIAWPGAPGAGDVVPFLLTLATLTASALVVWRASIWLARGSGA